MSIAAKANKVCKSIKKPMSIPSKTRKDQKAHEHTSNPCEKRLKPMKIATKRKSPNQAQTTAGGGNVRMETPSVENHSPLTRPHSFASPARSHARHEHETKPKPISRLGSPASIISPQSPIPSQISIENILKYIGNH